MSDLISRQAAIDAVNRAATKEAARWSIQELPSAKPKTGKWVRVDEKPYFRKHFHKVCCSNCNEEGYKKWNYCPNCGTKMQRIY